MLADDDLAPLLRKSTAKCDNQLDLQCVVRRENLEWLSVRGEILRKCLRQVLVSAGWQSVRCALIVTSLDCLHAHDHRLSSICLRLSCRRR